MGKILRQDLAGWRGSCVGLPFAPFYDLPAVGTGEIRMFDSTWARHNATKANLCALIFHPFHFLSWQFTFFIFQSAPLLFFVSYVSYSSYFSLTTGTYDMHFIPRKDLHFCSFLAFGIVLVAAKVLLQHRAQHLRATWLARSRRRWSSVANVVDRGSWDLGLGRWSTGLGRGAGEIRVIGEERKERVKSLGDVFLIKYERKEEGGFHTACETSSSIFADI